MQYVLQFQCYYWITNKIVHCVSYTTTNEWKAKHKELQTHKQHKTFWASGAHIEVPEEVGNFI